MAVTDTSLTLPLLPTPTPAPTQAPRQPAIAATGDAAGLRQQSPAPALSAAKPAPATFGLTLLFDNDTQRLILEARDPISGYVIYQVPAKYVIKQLSASAEPAVPRGRNVNRNL